MPRFNLFPGNADTINLKFFQTGGTYKFKRKFNKQGATEEG